MTDTGASGAVLDEITVSAPALPETTLQGDQQFGRRISLIVSNAAGQGLDFSQFHVVFRIQRGDLQNPNTADIRIYNLNDDTANAIAGNGSQFTQLALQVGYAGQNLGLVFAGTIAQARKGRANQLDSYVEFTAGDGDEAYNFATCIASLSTGNNGPQNQLNTYLRALQARASAGQGITQGYVGPLNTNGPARGRVVYGNVKDLMRRFTQTNDMTWSIQNGQLTVIPRSSYVPGNVIIISPSTGMIGSPEQIQNGVSVRVLLNPQIAIGQAIRIQDTTINQYRLTPGLVYQASNLQTKLTNKLNAQGLYYVMRADHSGDTRGNEWYTDLTCLAIDATLPVSSDTYLQQAFVNPGPIPRN